jgi:hypothetical protein
MPPFALPVSLGARVRGYFYRFCPTASQDFCLGYHPRQFVSISFYAAYSRMGSQLADSTGVVDFDGCTFRRFGVGMFAYVSDLARFENSPFGIGAASEW